MKKINLKLIASSIAIVCVATFFFSSCKSDSKQNEVAEAKTEVKSSQEPQKVKKTKMILDLDTGIDDAMSLAYALGSPEIELLGVVGIFGNVTVDVSVQNTLDLLELLNRTDVPVYRGSDRSILATAAFEPDEHIRLIHGQKGLGTINLPTAKRKPEQKDGVDFIIESAHKYGKDLTVVAVGPMTNIYKAIEKDPSIKDKIGNVVIMGGALTIPGNINPFAEANIYKDAEAADRLFKSGIKITMVGLDVTLRTVFTKNDIDRWREIGTPSAKVFSDMVEYYLGVYLQRSPALEGCALHDPLAVAIAIHPEFLTDSTSMHMKVETEGVSLGRTIGDETKLKVSNPNVKACLNVDHKKFTSNFYETTANLFKKGK